MVLSSCSWDVSLGEYTKRYLPMPKNYDSTLGSGLLRTMHAMEEYDDSTTEKHPRRWLCPMKGHLVRGMRPMSIHL